ncbi:unnamed protein product [Mycena citricolor]|uniref:Rubisco LSMT substrate-binding domain-containing protein n=1 Tax=Mycena citricolor TaxID=2018698 RepID=A0AAD2HKM8_9AGAR|nr:unnamed protein product [Mycena citricolor]
MEALSLSKLARFRMPDEALCYRDIPPSTPLFTIKASSLLNCRTLGPHYPPGLSAAQLVSLHLCVYRRMSDPIFGLYLATLPCDFDTHPLTSYVENGESPSLPPSVSKSLLELNGRFVKDWDQIAWGQREQQTVLSSKHPIVDSESFEGTLKSDFLWVNTRCVYHRLKKTRADPDNFTLCPILDFANHTVSGPTARPRLTEAERNDAAPIAKLGEALTLLSPTTPICAGEQMYLTYGPHSNRRLFVEYGFVIPCSPGDPRAEVDVDDLVEPLFNDEKKRVLQDVEYWGDWILDAGPAVSFRLITALRLLHCDTSSSVLWHDTLTGARDIVSDDNEIAWKRTVLDVCTSILERAAKRPNPIGVDSVDSLWLEEETVAQAICDYLVNQIT